MCEHQQRTVVVVVEQEVKVFLDATLITRKGYFSMSRHPFCLGVRCIFNQLWHFIVAIVCWSRSSGVL